MLKREAVALEGKPPAVVASSQADSAADAPGPSAVLETSDDTSEGSSRYVSFINNLSNNRQNKLVILIPMSPWTHSLLFYHILYSKSSIS